MNAFDFTKESNRIEGIHRDPTQEEINEYHRFMALDKVEVADLEMFVAVYQPGARLRIREGENVYVGRHVPPPGGQKILYKLDSLLNKRMSPYSKHVAYETLHPFTDGNGRSGRMLWMWQMRQAPLGFLHTFYYQALDQSRR